MPRKFKRNQRQCAGRERASADHEMTLRYGSDQGWNRNRINDPAESEACDHGFHEHGGEADLCARVRKYAAKTFARSRNIEPLRLGNHDAPEGKIRYDG